MFDDKEVYYQMEIPAPKRNSKNNWIFRKQTCAIKQKGCKHSFISLKENWMKLLRYNCSRNYDLLYAES